MVRSPEDEVAYLRLLWIDDGGSYDRQARRQPALLHAPRRCAPAVPKPVPRRGPEVNQLAAECLLENALASIARFVSDWPTTVNSNCWMMDSMSVHLCNDAALLLHMAEGGTPKIMPCIFLRFRNYARVLPLQQH